MTLEYQPVLSKDEMIYWEGWIGELAINNKLSWLNEQVHNSGLDELILKDLQHCWVLGKSVDILDVGSGPISVAGSSDLTGAFQVNRTCHDPLGNFYADLLNRNGIESPKYISCPAEDLSAHTDGKSFDYIFCRNALDHASSAPDAIKSIYGILKKGGIIRLRHYTNEAIYANYSGFHRWNFMNVGTECILFSQSKSVLINALLPEAACISYLSSRGNKDNVHSREYCEVLIFKDSWDDKKGIFHSRGLNVSLSAEKRAVLVQRDLIEYNINAPMFIHLHFESGVKSTTLVWGEEEFNRVISLYNWNHEPAEKIAFGQYIFEESTNHYEPKFSNLWYEELNIEVV